MCNVGRFLWDVDSLWEMRVGGTGLRRPGGLNIFSLSLSLFHCTACGFGDFWGLVCFVGFLRYGKGRASGYGKIWPLHAACDEPLVPEGSILHWSYPPKRMLVDAPESSHVPFFLLIVFILSGNHLLSNGFM